MMKLRWLPVMGLASIVTGLVGLVLLNTGSLGVMPADDTPEARGEWIFRTGRHPDDNRPIRFSGGMMMGMSCASCHGADGQGRSTMMFVAPDITYRNLTNPAGMREPNGTRGHTYTDDLIERAITQGIDAEGEALSWPMPHWKLSDDEVRDLIAYLKTLP